MLSACAYDSGSRRTEVPVFKYRDVSEMDERTWRHPGDPDLFRAIGATWEFAHRTTRPHFPPGVHKHRSFALAQKLRDSWERRNFESFRERRRLTDRVFVSDGDLSRAKQGGRP
jgi:hypothetical protein